MKLRLRLSYLGTNYCGFQYQPNGISVQQRLNEAAERCFGVFCPVTGCGRTDAGVHARDYCCTLEIPDGGNKIPPENVPAAMNRVLPEDISVKTAAVAEESFHARYSAKYKEYQYLVLNEPCRDPFYYGRAYHIPKRLDTTVMDGCARRFVGEHDFAGFMAAGSEISDTVRKVMYFKVSADGGLVTFTVAADGFLYNMVRIMVGTLIDVSRGRIPPGSLADVINSRDRSRAGFTAPPEGLYLNKVVY